MQQYFLKGVVKAEELTITDKDTIKHMFSVMRLKEGEKVILVLDDEVKYLSELVDASQYRFKVLESLSDNVELPVAVTIASAFPKGDKLEWIAQKVTELGASGVWAFPSAWSVVKWDSKKLGKKADKLAKIVQGAAEQSKRNCLPEVRLFDRQEDFLAQLGQFDKVVVAYEEAAKQGEVSVLTQALKDCQAGENWLLIFGSEGGLSPEEVANFEQVGAIKVGLGPRILRAETAPLYALSAMSYALELSNPHQNKG